MDFLKKHYEKILLSVVLLCLAIAAAWLPTKIRQGKEELQKTIVNLPKPIELKPVDLSTNEAALKRLQNPPTIELSGAHNLFNPVTWKVKPDGSFIKIVQEGVDALTVTKIQPLYLELAFERVTGTGYWIAITRQSSKKSRVYAKPNKKEELFTLKEVKGPPEDPEELILELNDGQETISISKDKPFKRVEAYAADLRYAPDSKNFLNQKVNDIITVAGESYKIIAITENEVRVSATSTDKRTTILWKAAPGAPDTNSQQPKTP
jgi:hypothetical protein